MRNPFSLSSISANQSFDMELDGKTDWVNAILDELNEGLESEEVSVYQGDLPMIKVSGELTRKKDELLKDFALITGEFSAKFLTHDVSTYEVMLDSVKSEIKAIVLEKGLEDDLGIGEQVTYLYKNEEYELFYFEHNKIPVSDIIHEYIFLNKDPYPKKNKEPEENLDESSDVF